MNRSIVYQKEDLDTLVDHVPIEYKASATKMMFDMMDHDAYDNTT